jgi:predicted CoA-binding protein
MGAAVENERKRFARFYTAMAAGRMIGQLDRRRRMAPADELAIVNRLLAARRIAVVGLSDDPRRPSYGVSAYMLEQGYEIIPVNPRCQEVFGRRAVATLAEAAEVAEAAGGPIDLVNVFRRGEQCASVAAEAIAAGAKGIWLQLGIHSDEARRLAEVAGVDYVENRCIMIDHMRSGR